MKKTPIIQSFVFACSLLVLVAAGNAALIEQSTISEVVKQVSVIDAASKRQKAAKALDVFRIPDILRTGSESRAEMIAPDQTVTRVGANTVFSFSPDKREINLQRGSVLFHSPAGKGGGTIKTAAATASVLGTTIIVVTTKNGGFKLLVLEGRGQAKLPNGKVRVLNAGQMIVITPGSVDFGPAYDFRLREQIPAALLVTGFQRPLPSMLKIKAAMEKQEIQIASGQLVATRYAVGEGGQALDPNPRQEQAAVLVPPQAGQASKSFAPALALIPNNPDINLSGVVFQTPSLALQARTINLSNVTFALGSKVNLASQNGQLAPKPNTGAPSLPGFVNYIRNVFYPVNLNGVVTLVPAQSQTGPGLPITITKRP